MTIIEALANSDTRLTCHESGRWMGADPKGEQIVFTVYERKRYARQTTVVFMTDDEELAVGYLLGKYD